jgi:hypothetical protein
MWRTQETEVEFRTFFDKLLQDDAKFKIYVWIFEWFEAVQMWFLRPLLEYTKLSGYKEKIESTKHSRRNSNVPEELERAHLNYARRETTKISI